MRDQADVLRDLEAEARLLESVHRYGPQRLRTVEHNCGVATLKVSCVYPDVTEDALLLWTTSTIEKSIGKRRVPTHLVYYCDTEGYRVRLTRTAALALLDQGDIAASTREALRVQKAAQAEQVARDREDQSLFDSLNRTERSASDRSFLMARWQLPRASVARLCNARPLGGNLSTLPDETRCILRPWHLGTEPHRNARGDVWGLVQRPIDRVEERRTVSW